MPEGDNNFVKNLNIVKDPKEIVITDGSRFNELKVKYLGKTFNGIVPRLPFPLSYPFFVILVDEQGNEVVAIKDYRCLEESSRKSLERSLERTYFMPRIISIRNLETSGDEFVWDVDTDRGRRVFRTRGRRSISSVGNRVIIVDLEDNIYVIFDVSSLDKRSESHLESIF